MSDFIIDVESDGPCPGPYSMVCFGAVFAHDTSKTFYGQISPISSDWIPEALAISGFTREQHLLFDEPEPVIKDFHQWVQDTNDRGRPVMWSDNIAYDWQWVNHYSHVYGKNNPFGFSGRRIGDVFCGMMGDLKANHKWKKFRKTKHTHNPVEDAQGNAEALHKIKTMLRRR
jgi:hypothetical protein